MLITLPKHYNHAEILRFLSRNEKECLHSIKQETIYKALEIDGEIILFSIDLEGNSLKINLSDEKHAENVKKYISAWFDLETDLGIFYEAIKEDEVLQKLCQKYKGLRMIGMPDLYESLVWSIIGQQINLSFAYSLKERLVKNFGKSIHHNGETFYALPKPSDLANLSIEDFLPFQFSRQKAQYIINVSKAFADGELVQKDLEKMSFEEVHAKLVKIKGVGNWTANYSMMKSLKNYDAFPVEDVGLHNAVKNQYGMEQKPSIALLHEMSKKWPNWRGYATFYFWHSLLD